MLGKEHWQTQLKWGTNCRKYVVVPCMVISAALTLYSVYKHDNSGAQWNLFVTTCNALIYVFNLRLCGKYSQLISVYENIEAQDK